MERYQVLRGRKPPAGPRAELTYPQAVAIARLIPMQRVTMGPTDEDVARALVAAWREGVLYGEAMGAGAEKLAGAFLHGADTARRAAADAVRSLKDEDFVDEDMAEIVEMIAQGIEQADLVSPDSPGRKCRACGCTDERACSGGCSWAEPDLCSACTGRPV